MLVEKIKISEKSEVHSSKIGQKTQIWQYVVILKNAEIGNNCNICSHCFIENDVIIGNNVTIKNHCALYDGVIIEDDVFIGPGTVFNNDIFPRSKTKRSEYGKTKVSRGASIGSNTVIMPGVTIGANVIIGSGSVVTKSIPDNVLAFGSPAKVIRNL